MAEDQSVHIVSWPKEPAGLAHHFDPDQPCPVVLSFDNSPAHVVVATERGASLAVNMNMNLKVPETLPICIKLCEPICAESNYTIGISIFDRPVVSLTIRGRTRLFSCREE